MFDNLLRKKLLSTLQHTRHGSIRIKLPSKEIMVFKGEYSGYNADIQIADWRVVANMSIKGDIGLAADYRDGYWHTYDLEELIKFGLQNDKLFQYFGNANFLFKRLSKILYLTKRNTLNGSKKNIQVHYDLGNEFYQLWLDPGMTYSSAIFTHSEQSLIDAQQQKYERLLSKISKPNVKILEVGCGWGGFAQHAILKGHSVKGITLSCEQAKYAKDRLKNYDAEIVIEDYRHQKGTYDFIVSIEMFEAVGKRYWPVYFNKLKSLLAPGGKILLQTITIADSLFKQYSQSADMIRTFIFPGGMLPSEIELHKQLKKTGLACQDIYRFGQDYALTLKKWLHSFDAKQRQIGNLGFDDNFIRLWRFYLAACSASFTVGRTNVVQMEITHSSK